MKKAVMCIVQRYDQAEGIVAQLQDVGFAPNDISVLFPDKSGTRDFAHRRNTKALVTRHAVAGTGGVLRGAIGLLAGIGALALPGLGPFIAAGPLMAALSGAALGAGAGGVTGALIGIGIPEIEARKYEGKLRGGNVLIAVHAEKPEDRKLAQQVFKRALADDIVTMSEASVPRDARR
jgi:hypothetical protein